MPAAPEIYFMTATELVRRVRSKRHTVVWNIEEGTRPSGPQIGQAERKRTEVFHRVRILMEPDEFLVSPVSRAGVTQRVSAASAVCSLQGR